MIKSVRINRFKSLSTCTITDLARVNLFVGRNNIGKSSVLEAISLLQSEGSVSWLRELLQNRGLASMFHNSDKDEAEILLQQNLASLFTGRDIDQFIRHPLTIFAKTDNGSPLSLLMQLGYFSYDTAIDESGKLENKRTFTNGIDFNGIDSLNKPQAAVTIESNDRDWRFYRLSDLGYTIGMNETKKRNFEFVRPTSTYSPNNAMLFDRIAMTELQPWLVKALNIIDPRIRDVNFLNNPSSKSEGRLSQSRVPIVVLKDDDTRYPLRSMGDGVNRLLTIVLSMLNCKGGILFVDELENGLHYTTMHKLWQMIFELAVQLDIQVFATTHSTDCIRSFIDAKNESGTIIRLEQYNDEIIGVNYTDPDELDYISHNNVEIR